jgi:hypothetical protein
MSTRYLQRRVISERDTRFGEDVTKAAIRKNVDMNTRDLPRRVISERDTRFGGDINDVVAGDIASVVVAPFFGVDGGDNDGDDDENNEGDDDDDDDDAKDKDEDEDDDDDEDDGVARRSR